MLLDPFRRYGRSRPPGGPDGEPVAMILPRGSLTLRISVDGEISRRVSA